jgi:hypothetical protein
MKWKDSEEMNDPVENDNEKEFFDEEQYSPWAPGKDSSKAVKLSRNVIVLGLLGFAVVTSLTALLMLFFVGQGKTPDQWQMNLLQERVIQLEERLSRYDAIDEKVTRIWEQANSFEKFKDRFERAEASMTMRMDSITADTDNLKKKFATTLSAPAALAPPKSASDQPSASVLYHTVAAGDTFYSISKRYQIDIESLRGRNGLDKDAILRIGQKLVINGAAP